MGEIECIKCSKLFSEDFPYCPHCGTKAEQNGRVCQNCGSSMSPTANVCKECGSVGGIKKQIENIPPIQSKVRPNYKILGIVAIIIIGIFVLASLPNPEKETTNTNNAPNEPTTPSIIVTVDDVKTSYGTSYISKYTDRPYYAEMGKSYLLLHVTIENVKCKDSVSTHQWSFKIISNNIEYTTDSYIGYNSLQTVDLLPGGKTEGYICFEVPAQDTIRYTLVYDPLLSGYNCDVEIKYK